MTLSCAVNNAGGVWSGWGLVGMDMDHGGGVYENHVCKFNELPWALVKTMHVLDFLM